MSDIAIIASFQDVMDMALGSPELGAVNFNLLNGVLQVMMKQMKLNDRYVQINGPDNDSISMLMGSTHPKLPVKLAKYHPIHGFREISAGISNAVPKSDGIERNWKITVLEPSSDQTTGTVCPARVVPVSDAVERTLEIQRNERRHPNENIPRLERSQKKDISQLIQQVESLKQKVEYLEGVVKSRKSFQKLEHVEEMFKDLEKTKATVARVAEQQKSLMRTLNNRLQEFTNYKDSIEKMQNHITLMQNQLDTSLAHTNVSAKPAKAVHDLSVTTLPKKALMTKIEGMDRQNVTYESDDATLSKSSSTESTSSDLSRRVSQDQLETACDGKTSEIEDAANKSMEEDIILDEPMQHVDSVKEKFQILKRRLKSMAGTKGKQEIGTRQSKLLMDENYIP